MDHKISFTETISMKENFQWELTTDAVIFRNEFEKHKKEYLDDPTEKNYSIIFGLILLQIYVEFFLHQNIRRIIRFEFKNKDSIKYQNWQKYESYYIDDKYREGKLRKRGKLSYFIGYFFNDRDPSAIEALKEKVQTNFKYITEIRNNLVHGNDISVLSDHAGNIKESKTKKLLTKDNFLETIYKTNELGSAWNELLNQIFPRCNILKQMDDFKFFKIEIDK